MTYEQGEWIMLGVDENDPYRLKTPEDVIALTDKLGFLPLFKNEIPGFSVEERTVPYHWWCDDPKIDPWQWREILAESGKVAYGKFFDKKAGFVSLKWLPYFANYRRDGYDFDARWDDEKANIRQKKIMDVFHDGEEHYSFETKQLAGFGKDGEKNFEGIVTELQMETYLVIRAFRCRRNKAGEPYGWPIAVYATPESIFGEEIVTSAYNEEPQASYEKIRAHLKEIYPIITDKQIKKLLR